MTYAATFFYAMTQIVLIVGVLVAMEARSI